MAAEKDPDVREFSVESDDKVEAHELLNEQMVKAGFRRISGDNYDKPGFVSAWAEEDDD